MKKISKFAALGWALFAVNSFAKSTSLRTGLGFDLEPVVGYERVQKLVPTPHTNDRLIFGGRATMGIPLLAIQAEYLRGMDTEAFPTQDLAITDTDDKLKLGLRSGLSLSTLLTFSVRAGVQATRNIHTETTSAGSTTTENPITYAPYAGAGLRVGLGRKFSFTGDLTTIFTDTKDLTKNEYQLTAGFRVSLP